MSGSEFVPHTAAHALTILGFALAWAGLTLIGMRLRGSARERAWRAALVAVVSVCWLAANLVQLLPGYFDASSNLPLQICDIAGMVLPFAMWLRTRLLLATMYFWGASFSVLAILLPDLQHGVATVAFWTFWLPHANLSGAACYLMFVERYRPQVEDCVRAFALSVLYLVLILPFDLLTGYNYGYVGPDQPTQPPMLSYLGPWPWRVLVILLLTGATFALLQWPWTKKPPRLVVALDGEQQS